MKKIAILVLLFVAINSIFVFNISPAEETKTKYLEEIEFLTGFIWGKLRSKENYNAVPLMVSFDFSPKPFLKDKFNFNPPQLIQFQVEPYLAVISSPDTNIETGTSFFIKLGVLPQISKVQPYIKAGLGMLYMSQHTREQSTQFNFQEQGGVGVHYFFRKNTALTAEYRYRHISNAGIDHPNTGINTHIAVVGVSYRF